MEFKYDYSAKLIDKSRNIRIEQTINPFTMQRINSMEDADAWMRTFLYMQLNALPLFFNIKIINKMTNEVVTNLNENTNYVFVISETFGKLTGKYNITITDLKKDEPIELTIQFIDGEARFEYSFNSKGKYVINLDNDFLIGKDKYVSIVTDIEAISFTVNNN